jgi:hydroxyacylglutathione hydrolase
VIEVVTIDTQSLGDRTYLATDGVSALVIDPQRDVDRVFAAAAARGVAVTDVFETHSCCTAPRVALSRHSGCRPQK